MQTLASISLIVFMISCQKIDVINGNVLSEADSIATKNMLNELAELKQALNHLMTASVESDRVHWDSIYHSHDSLFWVQHEHYHHEHYEHDDHHHEWVQYDTNVNHHHHYHPPYPNHHEDSLVTNGNNHHHDNHDRHFPGHDILEHHHIDSLHELHSHVRF